MANWSTQLIGLLVVVLPLVAIQWNLAGVSTRRSRLVTPENRRTRWRLEIYSNNDGIAAALPDLADVPFPVKRVGSAKQRKADRRPDRAWTLPRVELDVDVADPFAGDALEGLRGVQHRLRFVSGDEAVVDAPAGRLRIRAVRTA
jgi:hypothetical protein